jgi:hypothetical protein
LKLSIAVVAFLPLLFGCGVDRGSGKVVQQSVAATDTEDVSHDTFALGTMVTSRGEVPEDSEGETFVRGGDVFLSVDLSGASTEPVVEVRWLDPAGEVLHRDALRAKQGTKHVAFSSGATARWKPGPHRAVVLIDGRSVSEKRFTVM